jgi:hypothetical protein
MRTQWLLKERPGVAAALSVELTALPDGLVLTTGDQVITVPYRYDTMACRYAKGSLRQFLTCPSCASLRRTLYLDAGHWGCRKCLELRYPIRSSPRRAVIASQIEDTLRRLIETRPGSREWHELRARIADQHEALVGHVARMRRDLTKRLKRNHKRTVGENPVRAERRSPPQSGAEQSD